jgi:hypothetical protein
MCYEVNEIDDDEYWDAPVEKRATNPLPLCSERAKSFVGDWVPDYRLRTVHKIIDELGVRKLAYWRWEPTTV